MEHKLISASAARAKCGGVSDMTLWRWLHNSELEFPKPVYIGMRRYWRESDIDNWIAQRSGADPVA